MEIQEAHNQSAKIKKHNKYIKRVNEVKKIENDALKKYKDSQKVIIKKGIKVDIYV